MEVNKVSPTVSSLYKYAVRNMVFCLVQTVGELVPTSGAARLGKNLPAMWETRVQSLGQEDPLEKGMATHSTILAWRIPWTEATINGVRKSWYDWGANTFPFLSAKLWSGCWISCVRLNPESAPSVNCLGWFVSAYFRLLPFSQLMSTLWFVFQRPRRETACIFTPQYHPWGSVGEEYFLLSPSSRAFPRVLGVQMGSGDCPLVVLPAFLSHLLDAGRKLTF